MKHIKRLQRAFPLNDFAFLLEVYLIVVVTSLHTAAVQAALLSGPFLCAAK